MTSTKLRTLVSLANAKFQDWVVFKLFSTVTLGRAFGVVGDLTRENVAEISMNIMQLYYYEHYAIICNYIITYYSIPD